MSAFGVYVNVKILNYEQKPQYINYTICFCLTSDPAINWIIKKRYNEIFDFHEQFKQKFKNLKPPKLPKKKLILDRKDIDKRVEKLEIYLSQLLNDEVYFCPALFEFINIEQTDLH